MDGARERQWNIPMSADPFGSPPRERAPAVPGAAELRLRLMLEASPTIAWTLDRDLRFTSSVGAGLAALGLKADEVVGRSLFEFFGTDDPAFPPIAASTRALGGETVSYETEFEDRLFLSRVVPLRAPSGEVVGCLGSSQDVTDLRHAEEALRQPGGVRAAPPLGGGRVRPRAGRGAGRGGAEGASRGSRRFSTPTAWRSGSSRKTGTASCGVPSGPRRALPPHRSGRSPRGTSAGRSSTGAPATRRTPRGRPTSPPKPSASAPSPRTRRRSPSSRCGPVRSRSASWRSPRTGREDAWPPEMVAALPLFGEILAHALDRQRAAVLSQALDRIGAAASAAADLPSFFRRCTRPLRR